MRSPTASTSSGRIPSDLHYKGYTKSICTSVNGVICHGIPDDRPLEDGDIVNIDMTAYVDGMHGDTSATFHAGDPVDALAGLVETTREATLRGIAAIRPFEPLQRIAEAIEPFTDRGDTRSSANTAATESEPPSTPTPTSPTTSTAATASSSRPA